MRVKPICAYDDSVLNAVFSLKFTCRITYFRMKCLTSAFSLVFICPTVPLILLISNIYNNCNQITG